MAVHDRFQAIVLCGGRGRRLGKMTEQIPKPAICVNQRPLLLHVVEQILRQPEIGKVILVGNYKQDVLMERVTPMINDLAPKTPVEWITQRYPESEGALLTGVSYATSDWVIARCGDDLLSDAVLHGLLRRRGIGTVMSRVVPDTHLPRLHIARGSIVGLTSDRNAPIMTYNLGMRTDLILDWSAKAVANERPLVEFLDQLPPGALFAVDGQASIGLNTPEDLEMVEQWYATWAEERRLMDRA